MAAPAVDFGAAAARLLLLLLLQAAARDCGAHRSDLLHAILLRVDGDNPQRHAYAGGFASGRCETMLQFGGTLVLSLLPTRASLAASSVAVSFSPPFNLFELRVCVRINRLLSWLVGGLRMAAAAMVLRVCVVLETGFSMLKDDAMPTSLVKSDSSLVGYDVAVRRSC